MTTYTTDQIKTMLDQATPGPWEAQDQDPQMDGRNFVLRQQGVAGIRLQAHCYGHNGDPELIAAAPDLAAEVVRLREGLEGICEQVERYAAMHVDLRADHVSRKVRALLDGDQS